MLQDFCFHFSYGDCTKPLNTLKKGSKVVVVAMTKLIASITQASKHCVVVEIGRHVRIIIGYMEIQVNIDLQVPNTVLMQ